MSKVAELFEDISDDYLNKKLSISEISKKHNVPEKYIVDMIESELDSESAEYPDEDPES